MGFSQVGLRSEPGGRGPWADKLLPLPEFLRSGWDVAIPVSSADLAAAFRLTGHFLEARLGPSLARERVPAARNRAVDVILRRHGHSDLRAEAAEP